MRLEYVKISGYRSLYEVALRPGPLTVLTGPNNSGKTNFVEALDFLADAYRHSVEVAINRKGGIENIAYRRMRRTRRPISFEIDCIIPAAEATNVVRDFGLDDQDIQVPTVKLHHSFSIAPVSQTIETDFIIERELVELSHYGTSAPTRFLTLRRVRDGVTVSALTRRAPARGMVFPYHRKDFRETWGTTIRSRDLMIDFAFNPLIRKYVETQARTRLYQLVALQCRAPGVPTANAEVELHGENLPALVAYLRSKHPAAWNRIRMAMRRIAPSLIDVRTEFTPDRRLALQFVEEGVGRPWSSEDISDGTIQALALYGTLFDPRVSLLMVEEPENSTHPWIVRNFVDACRDVKGKQIIVTTHSPALINYLEPKEVFMVWREEGRTHVEPLVAVDPDVQALWSSGKSTVFEMLDSGWLPQSVPDGATNA
jgi:predicted ATPase